jgi:hypothetical protein
MIVKCICSYPPQDALHGKGNRVANLTKHRDPTKVRCTVCGALISVSSKESSSEKKVSTNARRR